MSLEGQGSLFKVAWESFADKGWEPEALLHLELRVTEGFHEVEPEEAVSFYVNKDLPLLHSLLSPTASRHPKLSVTAKIMLKVIGAMALADISLPVLRDLDHSVDEGMIDLESLDPESMAGRVVELLRNANTGDDEAMRLAVENPSEIRDRLQGLVQVGSTLDQRALDRLMRP